MANPMKVMVQVEEIINHGQGVYELILSPLGSVPRFKPGQFLHLTIDEYDPAGGFWPESRVFSIASKSGDKMLRIVFSVKGRYTKLMEQRLHAGLRIWVKLPFGDFSIESCSHPGSDIVLIAGGTGLCPFMPYLAELVENKSPSNKIRLYYGVKNSDQILAADTLHLCQTAGFIQLQIWIEAEYSNLSKIFASEVRRGMLDIKTISNECQDLKMPDFFLSGPPAMIDYFKTTLCSLGREVERIHIDEWE